jgi:hypothetical protein
MKNILELIIDAAKNDDMNRVIELAETQQDEFCDNNCVWTNHHPKCVRAEPEWYHVIDVHGCNRFYHRTEDCPYKVKTPLYTTPQPKQEQGEPVGVMVSMDVSKGDEPEYRIFGRIYEVMRDGEGEDEVTYLAIQESRNFETPQQRKPLTDEVIVPLDILEAAESSLAAFCSDHGWSDADMQNMDNLSAYIAQHKAAHGIKE